MNDTKWIDSFTRALADITEPEKRSLLYVVLIGVINEYKKGTYDGMAGIEILNSFGIKCKPISASATEEKEKKNKKKTTKNGETTALEV